MPLSLIAAVLLSAVLHATWNSFVKVGRDRLASVVAIAVTGGLLSLPVTAFVPPLTPACLPFLLGSVVTHVVYYYCLINAYRFGDLSRVYPLARGLAPPLVALGAALAAGEMLSGSEIAGIALVSCGIGSLVIVPGRADGESPRAVWFALATGGMIAVYTVIDGMGARCAGFAVSYIAWMNVAEALGVLAMACARRGTRLWAPLRRSMPNGLLAGGMATLGYGIVIYAMSRGGMAHVSALRETSVVIAALIGTVALGERGAVHRVASAAIVALGVVVMNWR